MDKLLISVPNQLASRFRAPVPATQRSKVIVKLLEVELKKREQLLYQTALAVEQDDLLHQEMLDWNVTINDGLEDESW